MTSVVPRVRNVHTAIVGAGLSGLAAAKVLVAAGRDVVVLEARERVGGRSYTIDRGGFAIDLGGQWVGPTQDRVLGLARELGIATFPQYKEGARLLELDGALSRYRGTIPAVPLFDKLVAGLGLARIELASRMLSRTSPWESRRARALDRESLHAWSERALPSAKARKLLSLGVEMIFAAHPREISRLSALSYVRSGGGFTRLAEVENGAQQDRFHRGAMSLSLELAARLGDVVQAGFPVRAVTQDARGVTLEGEAGVVRARYAILALAPPMAAGIRFLPSLPPAREALHLGMPMGSVIKVVVIYDRPFWREAGLTGEVLSDAGPCRGLFDDGSGDGTHHALVGFIMADEARHFGDVAESTRKAAVVAQLVRLFGPAAARPDDYVEHDWRADPWSAGCYTGLFPPGLMTRVGDALRTPVGRLHWAGTETAVRWAGYFDGAIEAGERAANEVIALNADGG